MKTKLQNSIKFLKRFFEPAFLDSKNSLKILIDGFLKSIVQVVVPVIFLPKAISLILSGDYKSASKFLIILFVAYVIISLSRSLFMLTWQYGTGYLFQKALYKKYLPIILKIDSSFFERSGTGKVLTKFNSGVEALSRISADFLSIILPVVTVFIVGFYSLYRQSLLAGLAYVFVSTLIYFAIGCNYYKQTVVRKKGMPIFFLIQSKITKAIMSKFEVLQSDMIEKEVEIIDKNYSSFYKIEKAALKKATPTHIMWYTPPAMLILTLLIQSLGLITMDVQTIAQITIFSSVFGDGLDKFFKILTGTINEYPKVLAFWEMVDEPKMVGYEEGESFVHRGGEIELRTVDFAYEN